MPSKLKKAIDAVKDQTSISLAKVSNTNASNVEVLILKATRHDEAPIDDRYTSEVLQLISSNKVYAVACAQVISRRIGKTRNWIVALKSLMLVLKIFQDGDPYFPREVIHAMKRGHRILNLSSFRDDSHSSPWDYTAFVRTFALYLDERLDCFITGKLQRSLTTRTSHEPVCDMKPEILLDRISSWQRLLDRAIGTRPTGAAKTNKLVQVSLYSIVEESFDLYRDISDALALLLDSFFHLQYQSCVNAFQACVKASKQFEELCSFYDSCKSSGVGRTSEYPCVQKVSDELMDTLQEFLKDQSSFPTNERPPLSHFPTPPPNYKDPADGSGGFSSENGESICEYQASGPTERNSSERGSEFGSHTSLEDLMTLAELTGISPSPSVDHLSMVEPVEQRSQQDDHTSNCATNILSNHSLPIVQGTDLTSDNLFIDGWPAQEEHKNQEQTQQGEQHSALDLPEGSAGVKDDWELVLAETATKPIETAISLPIMADFIEQASTSVSEQQYNPFLRDENYLSDISTTVTSSTEQDGFPNNVDTFSIAPTFLATPKFCASPELSTVMAFQDQYDPFGECPPMIAHIKHAHSTGSLDQQILLQEQQLWLQNQNKIIAKRMA